jgi:hypothetical protein
VTEEIHPNLPQVRTVCHRRSANVLRRKATLAGGHSEGIFDYAPIMPPSRPARRDH